MRTADRIRVFAWFLHTHQNAETFNNSDIRACFRKVGLAVPDVSVYLPRMADSSPPVLLRDRGSYRLERTAKLSLDARYSQHQTTIAVSKLLADLPTKIHDEASRVFLEEALRCYRVQAFRAAIIMAWNLAFHHLLRWVLADSVRVAQFNVDLASRYPKRGALAVSRMEDFEELKESEVIEICRGGRLLSKNVTDILRDKIGRRNRAAHPSSVTINQHQADDMVTDLVNNVVLRLE